MKLQWQLGLVVFLMVAFVLVSDTPGMAQSQPSVDIALVGQTGGSVDALALQGSYAYVGIGPRLAVLDISDPAQPRNISQTDMLPGSVKGIALSGDYAYVAVGNAGLGVLDVSHPSQPQVLSVYGTPGSAEGVAISGHYAYVANADQGLRVVDVSDPMHPQEIGAYIMPGRAQIVAVSGDYAYVVTNPLWSGSQWVEGGLYVLDISNPSHPQQVGFWATSGWVREIALSGSYVYIPDGMAGLRVVDVSDPAHPQEIGGYAPPVGSVDGVAVSGRYAYLVGTQFWIVDISDLGHPQEVGSMPIFGGPTDVVLSTGYAYVLDGTDVHIVDITDPSHPQEIGAYETPGPVLRLAVSRSFVYLAGGEYGRLNVIDTSDPANPLLVFRSSSIEGEISDIVISGNYAYLAWRWGELQIFNISNSQRPQIVGSYILPGNATAMAIAVSGRYAYIAESPIWDGSQWAGGGLRVMDIGDPARPEAIGFYETSGWPTDVAVLGDYALVAGEMGLVVVDVSDPTRPQSVGHIDTPGNAHAVVVSGGYAYVADGENGLIVVDVSDPTRPQVVGHIDTPGNAHAVVVSGGYAYVADGENGLIVVDVSDPTRPQVVGSYGRFGYASDMAVVGRFIYVADWDNGLVILRITRYDLAPPKGVGTEDVTYQVGRWRQRNGDPNWDPWADVNGDGRVDVLDILAVAKRIRP